MLKSRLKSFLFFITALTAFASAALGAMPASAASVDNTANRVNSVARQISKVAGTDIKIFVIKDSTPEAYIYPGGIIVLTNGILEIAKTNDELAFVIGHEISHIINNSNHETISYIINSHNIPLLIKHEIEADISGMLLAEKAGFNPFASVKLLAKMLKDPSQSFDERLEAMSRFLSNKWDPYYWAE
ncbi:MAG: M48 family metalloprotease [Deltaproteobacteria bacterium]|nr:M48 family metalloprotease [Deltaproteobacteria bacterium]